MKGLPDAFKRPESLALAYFEASLVVEHLVELNGDAGLRTLLLAYADGATDADAFAKAFGKSVDAVDASFKTFVEQRYGALARAMAEPPEPGASRRPAGAARRERQLRRGTSSVSWRSGRRSCKAGDTAGAKARARAGGQAGAAGDRRRQPARAARADRREGRRSDARAPRAARAPDARSRRTSTAARQLAALVGTSRRRLTIATSRLRLVADLDPFDADSPRRCSASACSRRISPRRR